MPPFKPLLREGSPFPGTKKWESAARQQQRLISQFANRLAAVFCAGLEANVVCVHVRKASSPSAGSCKRHTIIIKTTGGNSARGAACGFTAWRRGDFRWLFVGLFCLESLYCCAPSSSSFGNKDFAFQRVFHELTPPCLRIEYLLILRVTLHTLPAPPPNCAHGPVPSPISTIDPHISSCPILDHAVVQEQEEDAPPASCQTPNSPRGGQVPISPQEGNSCFFCCILAARGGKMERREIEIAAAATHSTINETDKRYR